MAIRSEDITTILKSAIDQFDANVETRSVGTVVEVGDGIAQIYGLSGALASELLEFPGGVMGMALNLEEETVGAVILGDYKQIKEGDQVKTTGSVVEVPVGQALIGRVVNPLGAPLDGKGPIAASGQAPGRAHRARRDQAQERRYAGPDGHQGDRRADPDRPRPARADHRRPPDGQDRDRDRHDHQPEGQGPGLHLRRDRPEAVDRRQDGGRARAVRRDGAHHRRRRRCRGSRPGPVHRAVRRRAMGEEIMENGVELDGELVKDALCVYDDLTKHAWAYREMSLLLRRPPGREAYPGDVFYLHSRLLERAARLNEENGGGSLTALPIIETQANDVSAYIPTNVISITDGQIYLESDLFNAGQRPALNVGISVSRVGSAAQTKAMKKVAGPLKLDLAQYRELAAFAQFASDLDKATRDQLTRGEKTSEVLKQPQYEPLPVEKQVAILWVVTNGYLDDVPTPRVRDFEQRYYRFMEAEQADLLKSLGDQGGLTDDIVDGSARGDRGVQADVLGLAASAQPARDQAPHRVRAQHQADHPGDAVRGRLEAQARPGFDAPVAPVRGQDRRGPGRPRRRARRG